MTTLSEQAACPPSLSHVEQAQVEKHLDGVVRSAVQATLIEGEHAYVYLDGIWLKRCWGGEVRNIAVLVAVGVYADGYLEILGVMEGAKEDRESWRVRIDAGRGASAACVWNEVGHASIPGHRASPAGAGSRCRRGDAAIRGQGQRRAVQRVGREQLRFLRHGSGVRWQWKLPPSVRSQGESAIVAPSIGLTPGGLLASRARLRFTRQGSSSAGTVKKQTTSADQKEGRPSREGTPRTTQQTATGELA